MTQSRAQTIFRRVQLLGEIAERLAAKGDYKEAHNINHEAAIIANELFLAGYRDAEEAD